MALVRLQYAFLLLFASLIFGASGVSAQDQAPGFVEGQHYQKLATPVRTSNPDKIEVAIVFWYGCGHCYAWEPALRQWKNNLPDDVAFVETPAMWNKNMETHARVYYTSRALGVLDVMHDAVYDAIHLRKLGLVRTDEIKALYAQNRVPTDSFEKVFDSFSVTAQVRQAKERARAYGIEGTPEIVVDGKYRTSSRMAGSQMNVLAVVEHLAARIRQEKGVAGAN